VEGTAGEADLVAHAEAELVRYKRPVAWRIVEALPRTGVGKIDKAALRAMARQELAANAHVA
jgi:fatty-acyl-CoA synthase